MCGISGWFDLNGAGKPDEAVIRRMNYAIQHRGPDGDGFYFGPGVALAHRRLAIIDLATGSQPMASSDGQIIITFNGEIYNFRELHRELLGLGHRFRTRSDTEVIIQAWQQWGIESLQRLQGMFAFALFDLRKQCLLLARDRLGEKPLFYTVLPDKTLIFASELKALEQHPKLSRQIDGLAVEDFFSFGYVPDPKTIYAGVHKLEAASFILAHKRRALVPSRYWEVTPSTSGQDGAQLAEELRHRLALSVNSQLLADVPVGTFLSGGVDSGAITAMAASASSEPIRSFTIGFDEPGWDERPYASAVARQYNCRADSEVVQADDFRTLALLPSIYDEPFGDSSAMPTFRLCQLASRRVKVALSGDGGDELFAGYRRYAFHCREERLRGLFSSGFRRFVFGSLGRVYPQLDWLPRPLRAKQTFLELSHNSAEGYFENVRVLNSSIHTRLLRPDFRRQISGYRASDMILKFMAESPLRDPLGMAQYVDLKTWLVGDILTKVDRAAMACGLEVRVPMLDASFVQWAMGLDSSAKLRDGGKSLLKKALEPLLPYDVLYRQKQGFSVPLAKWFRSPLGEKMLPSLSEGTFLSEFIDVDFAKRLLVEHQRGWADHGKALWLLWTFGAFLRRISSPDPHAMQTSAFLDSGPTIAAC